MMVNAIRNYSHGGINNDSEPLWGLFLKDYASSPW